MSPILRFAPSPTGYLHVGNIRSALINWLFAKKEGGRFLLRLDDTDAERSTAEFEEAIKEDMCWLGLEWDGFARQRDRFARYDEVKQALIASGRLYPCYETPEELEIRRKMLAGRGLPPVYERGALKLSDAEKAKLEAEGRKPHWRFLLNDEEIAWQDMIRGPVKLNPKHISDPVLMREDGVPLYTFCSVVDDHDMEITHVLRGEDHVTNTAVQLQIFDALGYKRPTFGHNALLVLGEGKMSKRTGGGSIRELREMGLEPMAINSLLARLGTSQPVEPVADLDTLARQFDISAFGRAPARFDVAEVEKLNGAVLQQMEYAQVKDRLTDAGLAEADEAFWLRVRGNLKRFDEVKDWWRILHQQLTPEIAAEDEAYLKQAADLLPPVPWDGTVYNGWIEALKVNTDRKGRSLFMPLRMALTGRHDGPELRDVFTMIEPGIAAKRLRGEAA